jgi:hypothetical protein
MNGKLNEMVLELMDQRVLEFLANRFLYWYSVCNVKQVAKFFENNRLRRIGV